MSPRLFSSSTGSKIKRVWLDKHSFEYVGAEVRWDGVVDFHIANDLDGTYISMNKVGLVKIREVIDWCLANLPEVEEEDKENA